MSPHVRAVTLAVMDWLEQAAKLRQWNRNGHALRTSLQGTPRPTAAV